MVQISNISGRWLHMFIQKITILFIGISLSIGSLLQTLGEYSAVVTF